MNYNILKTHKRKFSTGGADYSLLFKNILHFSIVKGYIYALVGCCCRGRLMRSQYLTYGWGLVGQLDPSTAHQLHMILQE